MPPEEYPRSALARMSGPIIFPVVVEIFPVVVEIFPLVVNIVPLVPTSPAELTLNWSLLPTARVVKSPAEPETVVVPVTVFAVRLFIERSTVPVTLVELVIVLGPAGPAGPVAPDNTVS